MSIVEFSIILQYYSCTCLPCYSINLVNLFHKLENFLIVPFYYKNRNFFFKSWRKLFKMFIRAGKREMIYAKLEEESLKTSGFEVYLREKIPKKWHYGNNKRISSIFVIAKTGYAFEELSNSFKYYEKTFNISSEYGNNE